jgi:hypothetical protein
MERRLLYKSKSKNGWRPDMWPAVEVTFEQHEYVYSLFYKGEKDMRTVFTIELKVDIASVDEERRKAFIDLAMETAKQIYSQAAMVAAKSPSITVSEVGAKGKINHPLFEETQPPE